MLNKNPAMRRRYIVLTPVLAVFIALVLTGCGSENKQPETAAQQEVPVSDESLYQLAGEWHSQNGDTLELSKLSGKIPVMTMIFTRCDFACPRIVDDLKKIEKQVPADKKDQVVFVLVSFDSERDTPDKLKEFAKKMKLNNKWLLLHGDEEQVRELSMLLDVKYKKQPDGSFSHSNGITLLDTGGSIAAHIEGLGVDPKPIVSRFKDM